MDIEEMIKAMAERDPRVAQMAALLNRQRGTPPEVAAGPASAAPALGDPRMQLLAQLLSMRKRKGPPRKVAGSRGKRPGRRQLAEMLDELQHLRARVEELAAACGACPACFGDDPGCRRCRGRGAPGTRMPDADGWRHYIQPSLYKLGLIADSPEGAAVQHAPPETAETTPRATSDRANEE